MMSRGFSCQIENLPIQEIAVKFVYSRQKKMKKFSPKDDDNEKFWLEVIIATFMDALTTVDILTTRNNDVRLIETLLLHDQKSSSCFERINKLDRDISRVGNFITRFLKCHVTLFLSHQSLRACKDGGHRK